MGRTSGPTTINVILPWLAFKDPRNQTLMMASILVQALLNNDQCLRHLVRFPSTTEYKGHQPQNWEATKAELHRLIHSLLEMVRPEMLETKESYWSTCDIAKQYMRNSMAVMPMWHKLFVPLLQANDVVFEVCVFDPASSYQELLAKSPFSLPSTCIRHIDWSPGHD